MPHPACFRLRLGSYDPTLSSDRLCTSPMPPMVTLAPAALDGLRSEFDSLYYLPQPIPVDARRRAAIRVRLADIIARYFAYPPVMPLVDLPVWLAALCDQMRDPAHFIEGRSALLRLAARSEEHVARSFRAHLHTTPSTFINDLRVDHAARLLIHTDQPIVDIIYESGFQNLSYFYHLFHVRWQLSPRDYRRRYRIGLIPPR